MWIIDLNMKHKTMKLPKENIGENLCHLRLNKNFLGTTPKTKSVKAQINKLHFIKS